MRFPPERILIGTLGLEFPLSRNLSYSQFSNRDRTRFLRPPRWIPLFSLITRHNASPYAEFLIGTLHIQESRQPAGNKLLTQFLIGTKIATGSHLSLPFVPNPVSSI